LNRAFEGIKQNTRRKKSKGGNFLKSVLGEQVLEIWDIRKVLPTSLLIWITESIDKLLVRSMIEYDSESSL
jgi:hypothetical protein